MKKYIEPNDEIKEAFEEFKKNSEYVMKLFGAFYNEDCKSFYLNKLLKARKSLLKMERNIRKQYKEVLKPPTTSPVFKAKYKAIKHILKIQPDLHKKEVADLVDCSVRHVERVLYGEV